MQYVYTALLLHSAGHKVEESAVTKVMEAAGAKPDSARVKALIASLKDVNIEEAIKKAAVQPVAAAKAEEKPSAKKEEKAPEGKTEEEAAEGLSSLFG
ncbi:MAG: 50S ribosomal protein P1 [Candidatus Diapherotrites archaeon]|nr:50S ribosomal protein P1 [Candidatus Diapherotrites archaeon]